MHTLKLHAYQQERWGNFLTKGDVVGVSADMIHGRLMYSVNGNWGAPMGVAFTGLDTAKGLFPMYHIGRKLFMPVDFYTNYYVINIKLKVLHAHLFV